MSVVSTQTGSRIVSRMSGAPHRRSLCAPSPSFLWILAESSTLKHLHKHRTVLLVVHMTHTSIVILMGPPPPESPQALLSWGTVAGTSDAAFVFVLVWPVCVIQFPFRPDRRTSFTSSRFLFFIVHSMRPVRHRVNSLPFLLGSVGRS